MLKKTVDFNMLNVVELIDMNIMKVFTMITLKSKSKSSNEQ